MAGCNISKKTKVNLGGKINLKFGGKSKVWVEVDKGYLQW